MIFASKPWFHYQLSQRVVQKIYFVIDDTLAVAAINFKITQRLSISSLVRDYEFEKPWEMIRIFSVVLNLSF